MSVLLTVNSSMTGNSADSTTQMDARRASGGAVVPFDPDGVHPHKNNYVASTTATSSPTAVCSAVTDHAAQATLLKLAINGVDPAVAVMAKDKRVVVFSIHPETARLVAYIAFWVMVALAWFTTTVFVKEDLSVSPLMQKFGYNNVCIYWDYAPATAVTAMFYPVVEIPLILYIVLNFLRLRQAYRAGQVSGVRFAVCTAFLPMELTFTIWFRMIFVVHAFDDVVGHTVGFHGLMIALCLVALQNFLYHDSIGKLVGPRWISIGYLVALYAVTMTKLIIVWSIFGGTPLWSTSNDAGNRFAHSMDICWMILAAVIPIGLAYKNRKVTPSMDIAFNEQSPATAVILEKRGEAF